MSYLIRDGMRPITEGFAEAWREYSEHRPGPKDKPLKGTGVTPEQFADAMGALGISGARELSELLGQSERNARYILNDPCGKLLESHMSVIRRRYREKIGALADAERDAEGVARACPWDAEYQEDAVAAQRKLGEFAIRCAPLGLDGRTEEFERAARKELTARALVEGFRELSQDDRDVLVRVLSSMLAAGGSGRGRSISRVLEKAQDGAIGAPNDLAFIIGNEVADEWVWPYDCDEFDAYSVILDEYVGKGDSDRKHQV